MAILSAHGTKKGLVAGGQRWPLQLDVVRNIVWPPARMPSHACMNDVISGLACGWHFASDSTWQDQAFVILCARNCL